MQSQRWPSPSPLFLWAPLRLSRDSGQGARFPLNIWTCKPSRVLSLAVAGWSGQHLCHPQLALALARESHSGPHSSMTGTKPHWRSLPCEWGPPPCPGQPSCFDEVTQMGRLPSLGLQNKELGANADTCALGLRYTCMPRGADRPRRGCPAKAAWE